MTPAKLLFAGTPDFALASLRALVDAGCIPAAVLTQPDRPAGRGKKLTASPVKRYALDHDIPVWQPRTLKDADLVEQIAAAAPDIIIVAAYGLILPQAVLDIPRLGCLNVHASLLPRWRGAAPIQQAILNGDGETGICLMQMEAGLDTGPVYASAAIAVGDEETAGELHDRLAELGGELLVAKLADIVAGKLEAAPQDDAGATYAAKIRTQDAAIDWSATAEEISRKIRAYNPVPGSWFDLGGERIKCWRASVINDGEGPPGVVLQAGKDGIDITCGRGALRILELQRPGRRKVSAGEFAAQQALAGKRLG
jgi:methionyl-tRNA formyltransferase